MSRQLRIGNLFFFLAAFASGVAFADLFISEISPPSVESKTPNVEHGVHTCATVWVSEEHNLRIDTERGFALADRIRQTELKLIEVKKRSSIYSDTAEDKMGKLQRRLEATLAKLLEANSELESELRKLNPPKLVKREICYEN